MRSILIIICMAVLSACSGTGMQPFSTTMQMSENSEGSVFVLRDTGFVGSGALMTVSLNGKKIGKIGKGESVLGKMSKNNNYLEANFTGLASIGLKPVQASFAKTRKGNKYFIIKLQTGLFLNELEMFEVSESTFKSSL